MIMPDKFQFQNEKMVIAFMKYCHLSYF